MESSNPLSGIRVISFTHFLQGPSASQLLADLGADVIKIEPASGAFERSWSAPGDRIGDESPFFALGNRNVRSMVIDLKNPLSRPVVLALLQDADVLIESFRPGTLDRMGLSYDTLAALNPRLVYASLSGYGTAGPYVDRPGQDVLIQALSGLAAATGAADQPPTPVGACVVDQHAAVLGAFGILAALHGRARTGRGTRVESNLLNAALDLQIEPLTYALNGLRGERSPSGVSSRYYRAPYGVFRTSDGHICVSLTALSTLASVFDDEWFSHLPEENAYARREEINERIAAQLIRQSTRVWSERFQDARMWFAEVNDYDQVIADPQVLFNDSFDSYEQHDGTTMRVLKHPVTYGGHRPGVTTPPPTLGAHTRDILQQAGYSAEDAEELYRTGAVA